MSFGYKINFRGQYNIFRLKKVEILVFRVQILETYSWITKATYNYKKMLQTYNVSFAQVHITILKNKDHLIVFFFKKKTSIQDKPSRPKHAWVLNFKQSHSSSLYTHDFFKKDFF